MPGYLIGEEGPLTGVVLGFEEGTEWVIGRDADVVDWVLEDPKVSRKHAVCRKLDDKFIFENLSVINPATKNGKAIVEPVVLEEADIVCIGDTFFRFSRKPFLHEESIPYATMGDESSELSSVISIHSPNEARWMIKVIAGPNMGAEFHMGSDKTYVVGKDATLCDVILQDLSVSRQHLRIILNADNEVFLEDLGSRNGTFVNGELLTDRRSLKSEDLVVMGTTSFLVVDRNQDRETLVSEAPVLATVSDTVHELKDQVVENLSNFSILKRHLVLIGFLGTILMVLVISVVLLFQDKLVEVPPQHEQEQLAHIVKQYMGVQFSYNEGSGQLFLIGHVLAPVEKQELLYQIKGLSFLTNINDNIIVDEYVWDNVNALLVANPNWQRVSVHSSLPGKFVVRGYLETLEQAQALSDYLNLNFPYLDRLENQVVVEANLKMQIESLLMTRGFNNVQYRILDGEVVLSGRVDGKDESKFESLLLKFKGLPGVRILKNYVIYTTKESSLVDLSDKYKVTGSSKSDGKSQFVVINGKILGIGEVLDEMIIVEIASNFILLEKDGLKFKINYNLQ